MNLLTRPTLLSDSGFKTDASHYTCHSKTGIYLQDLWISFCVNLLVVLCIVSSLSVIKIIV